MTLPNPPRKSEDICYDAIWKFYDCYEEDRARQFAQTLASVIFYVEEESKQYEEEWNKKPSDEWMKWRAIVHWVLIEDADQMVEKLLWDLDCDIIEVLERIIEEQKSLDKDATEEYNERQEEYRRMVRGY